MTIFSKIIRGEIPCNKVYENDQFLAFHDINPKAPIHILIIPKGYFNGHMSLTDDAELLIFSNKTLQESVSDDFRLPHNYWNNWEISQR